MSSEDEDIVYLSDTPEDVQTFKLPHSTYPHGLPPGTLHKYNLIYESFHKWNKSNGSTPITENLLMKFFLELAERSKPNTLWAYYSMLKATFKSKDNVDISSYSKLIEYLKSKNLGFKPFRAKIFTEEEIEKFINEAPDDNWIHIKVVCIFAVNGMQNSKTLVSVKVNHVKKYEDMIFVTVPNAETGQKFSFLLTGTYFDIVQKYIAMRPENLKETRFFMHCRDGKYRVQPIGKTTVADFPRRIAKYLNLPDAKQYTSNSYRKTKANVTNPTNKWSSSIVPEEQADYSLDYETGLLKTPFVPSSNNSNHTNATNDNLDDHVCTIACGEVKCAAEENENSVLHAFTIMKPQDYAITDVTPALLDSDPNCRSSTNCRWIVAYTHINELVSSYNAYETFEAITRSIPNNVRIVQKYIRRHSSQMLAAYVVVYGVNCRCQKQSMNIFNFSVTEMKCEF